MTVLYIKLVGFGVKETTAGPTMLIRVKLVPDVKISLAALLSPQVDCMKPGCQYMCFCKQLCISLFILDELLLAAILNLAVKLHAGAGVCQSRSGFSGTMEMSVMSSFLSSLTVLKLIC